MAMLITQTARRAVGVNATFAISQPGLERRHVAGEDVEHLTEWLVIVLGTRLTAFAAGAETAEEVDRVAHGTPPDAGLERRLRNLYAITAFLAAEDGPGSAHEWLVEPNPELDDRSPASLLHDGEVPEAVWFAAASPTF
jgi:hypothetical protein